MNTRENTLPLDGVRVLEFLDGMCEGTGRILADLGADVIKVEPQGGSPSRKQGLLADGTSLTYTAANANKRRLVVDLAPGPRPQSLLRMISESDIILLGGRRSQIFPDDFDPARLAAANPALVLMEVSWFGKTGPYRDWIGTSDVLAAMSGLLAKSGLPGRDPLLPPEHLIDVAASAQAAWTLTLALWKQRTTGMGELIDFSVFEAVAVSLDPAFGISGSARGAASDLPHGRPDARQLYPIFACADGWARICLLSARQWDNMIEWMGRPSELADPKYRSMKERYRAANAIIPLLAEFLGGRSRAQIVEESTKFGVPTAGLLELSEVLTTPHFIARDTFVDVPVGSVGAAKMPRRFFDIDGVGVGYRAGVTDVEPEQDEIDWQPRSSMAASTAPARPFNGIRVLDLGVIVAGAESGRLFSDWGADVIKVENRQYPDGNRQGAEPGQVTQSFARGHRNKRSLGLNLRSERGREIFLDLVRESDVLLSNFKPGTLESLGLAYDVLKVVNPRLVAADSSAFGATGPWSRRMGYGPLVRATTGLSGLWSYPGDDDGFSDAITIYPDHVASRFVAVAVIALLLRRERTGFGGTASVAQIDVLLGQMADRVMFESLYPGALPAAGSHRGGDAPRGVFPCEGNDEWCVIDVHSDQEFRRLAEALSVPAWREQNSFHSAAGRLALKESIEEHVRNWTRRHSARDAMTILQEYGVPCGYMQRGSEFQADPQLMARGFLRVQAQPQFDGSLLTQNGEAVFSSIGPPQFGAAPVHGEHTEQICHELLGIAATEFARLVADGTLEVPDPVARGSVEIR